MIKFREIQLPLLPKSNLGKYWAHEKESLLEHSDATVKHFLRICDDGLESIMDTQIEKVFGARYETVKKIILNAIYLHDIGKINPAFQQKIGNPDFSNCTGKDSNHSESGWIIFSLMHWEEVLSLGYGDETAKAMIITTVPAGHHTFAWGIVGQDKLPTKEKIENAKAFSRSAGLQEPDEKMVKRFLSAWSNFDFAPPKEFFMLYKTVYSALILADAKATSERKRGAYAESSVITPNDLGRWRNHLGESTHVRCAMSNAARLNALGPNEIDSINDLRCKIFLETSKNLELGLREGARIFYLEAPTGSGKTNCAINLILKSLEIDPTLKRAFFVLPFINLIEQTVEVIKNSISAQPSDVFEVHSLAEWESKDDGYEREYDDRIFLNGKITILSSVNFLEALGSSRKSSNYKICNLSNSVIVVDELQSVDDRLWTYFQFLLEEFAELNNCRIILMSATLPRIDRINAETSDANKSFFELLPDAEEYQKHPCFTKRANIIMKKEIRTIEEVIEFVKNLLEQVSPPKKILIVANTVERSKNIFDNLPEVFKTKCGKTTFEKYLLNSELLPHKKRETIEKVKQNIKNLILISTQCIEAGIDADFDIGLRDYSIPDSLEQVAGRVNREGKNADGYLYVISLKDKEKSDAERVYGSSRRWKACEHMGDRLEDMLRKRDYAEYYSELIKYIQGMNSKPRSYDVEGRSQMRDAEKMHLKKLRDFQAIKDDNRQSYFIPIDLPRSVFNDNELRLAGLIPKALKNGEILGKIIWDEYKKSLSERRSPAQRAIFSSILNKFIANKWSRDRPSESLILLENLWEYDLKSGFKDSENIF